MTVVVPAIGTPPEEPEALLAWADEQGLADRLDRPIFDAYGAQDPDNAVTYRQALVLRKHPKHGRVDFLTQSRARSQLHRMATNAARRTAERSWQVAHGRDPEDETLRAFLEALRARARTLSYDRDPLAYEPVSVHVARDPVPSLRFEETPLVGRYEARAGGVRETALFLVGWSDGPLRFARLRDGVRERDASPDEELAALEAFEAFLRDERHADAHAELADVLRTPAWRFALGVLDRTLAPGPDPTRRAAREERVAFRVSRGRDGAIDIQPMVQKLMRGQTFSKGARLPWYELPNRADLSEAERRASRAHDDRFARGAGTWTAVPGPEQAFGILRALIDHPAVFLDGAESEGRLDIRLGQPRLRFTTADDGSLAPSFDFLGRTFLPEELAAGLVGDRYVMLLERPAQAPPQILLAELDPRAAALVKAFAVAPGRFPADAHDALAARLEPLQEALEIEFPSRWTRTVSEADGRIVVRLELLASGALGIVLVVRPVRLGPVFAPGEGPALLLEGQGRARHGVRRDRAGERRSAQALVARLGLEGHEEREPWSWRVAEGDPAFELVDKLQAEEDIVVEWADDARLVTLGSVGRGAMRMKVADRRDWFAVEGGAQVAGEVVPLPELLAAIREGRRYVAVGTRGFARIEDALRKALVRAGDALAVHRGSVELVGAASDPLVGLVEHEAQIEASEAFRLVRRRIRESAAEAAVVSPALAKTLRPYQRAGVEWMVRLAHWGAGAVLADEMGLGKTIQTLAVLVHRARLGPALVVAPTSVVGNWVEEAAKFAPELHLRLFRGSERSKKLGKLGPGSLVVTSYTLAARDIEALAAVRFGSLVLDEAQAVKNATTERSKALRRIDADWRLGLTGTPIENHLGELWSLMRIIAPGFLGSWEQFRGRFAVPIEKFGDEERRAALAALLRPFVLRRTKAEVARDLPARTELVKKVVLGDDERALYDELRKSTLDELARAKKDKDRNAADLRMVLLAAITRLRQLCCHPRLVYPRSHAGSTKAAYLLELCGELREGGHKTLVFSQFRSFLELLAPRLRQHGFRVLVLDGTTPAESRRQRIDAFQAGEADVFLISLKAGGFGLNLTAADTVIHLDPWWNPAVEDQATARAHRIGQDKPVTAIRLVASDTIEEGVLSLHADKRALAAALLDGTDAAARLDTEALLALIREA